MKNETYNLLKSRLFDFTQLPPPQNKIFTINDNLILSRGNFMLLTGLPKVGKSLITSIIIASALSNNEYFKLKVNRPLDKNIIALFDTEMGYNDLYNSINNSFNIIINETGISLNKIYYNLKSFLNVFSMREDDPSPILEMIEIYLENNKKTGLIIIDGLLDCVYNYNDEKEAKLLINFLKRITKKFDIGIICIIHTGKTTGSTIGHVGAFADRYCQSNLEIIKENNTVVLKPKFLRSSRDFDPIAFERIENKIFEVDYISQKKK